MRRKVHKGLKLVKASVNSSHIVLCDGCVLRGGHYCRNTPLCERECGEDKIFVNDPIAAELELGVM